MTCATCHGTRLVTVVLLSGDEVQSRTCLDCRHVAAATETSAPAGLWLPWGADEPGTVDQFRQGARQYGLRAWDGPSKPWGGAPQYETGKKGPQ